MSIAHRCRVAVLKPVSLFFFSSRRRHTSWPRDWSSDVCSSDLSAPGPCGAPGGIFSFAAFPASSKDSNSIRCARLYLAGSNGMPFLCHSVFARCMDMSVPLHSKNAESRFLDRCVEGRRNRKRQGAARLLGRDHSVVPEARGGIVGMSLPFVLVENRALEVLFLLLAPGAALGLDSVAFHRGEDGSRLLPSHHRDAGVRPHPQEAGREGAAAHAVVAGTERAADDDRELRHAAACDRGHHL